MVTLCRNRLTDVNITNLFPPTVEVLYPNGGEIVGPEPITITRDARDPNVEDSLLYSVYISNDAGETWEQIARYRRDISSFEWDPVEGRFTPGSQYFVKVTVTDRLFEVSDVSDTVFTFIDIAKITSTSMTTIETSSTEKKSASFDLIGLAAAAVLILCLTKRKRFQN